MQICYKCYNVTTLLSKYHSKIIGVYNIVTYYIIYIYKYIYINILYKKIGVTFL